MAHVDPVREPDAYQRMLLGLLGSDDPAAVQAATPAALRGLGPESYELTFRLLAGHDRFRLDQARRALDAVRRRA